MHRHQRVPTATATEEVRFPGPSTELIGVFARPAEAQGAVLVIHENRGLTAHIRTIPGRLAADGYAALAIDLLSEEGGTASLPSEGDATAALGNAPAERLIADLRAGLDELERRVPGVGLGCHRILLRRWDGLAAARRRRAAPLRRRPVLRSGARGPGLQRVAERRCPGRLRRAR